MVSTDGVPSTALKAYIFCIRKSGDNGNPLNYGPIALLNTDYKLFTRIQACRVNIHIPNMIHASQFGFVAERTIHDAIDLFEAAATMASSSQDLTEAQALLLDYAKAYDSLDRTFLLGVLKRKGFSAQFCRVVEALHTGKTVRFLANGATPAPIPVTGGIRQGCFLAPLLFILAVDVLYDEIETVTMTRGIELNTTNGPRELRVAGYADHTAIYIEHGHAGTHDCGSETIL